MEINQVRIGNYVLGNSDKLKKNDQQESKDVLQSSKQQTVQQQVPAEDIFGAMELISQQNIAQIGVAKAKDDVSVDYVGKALSILGQERSDEIKAMMGVFENGVNDVSKVVGEEIPGVFSPATLNELSAKIFAEG